MLLQEKHIRDAVSENGGWSRQQLELIGVAWPPPKGWLQAVVGTWIEADKLKLFLDLKGKHVKKRRGKVTPMMFRNNPQRELRDLIWEIRTAQQYLSEDDWWVIHRLNKAAWQIVVLSCDHMVTPTNRAKPILVALRNAIQQAEDSKK